MIIYYLSRWVLPSSHWMFSLLLVYSSSCAAFSYRITMLTYDNSYFSFISSFFAAALRRRYLISQHLCPGDDDEAKKEKSSNVQQQQKKWNSTCSRRKEEAERFQDIDNTPCSMKCTYESGLRDKVNNFGQHRMCVLLAYFVFCEWIIMKFAHYSDFLQLYF